MLILFSSTVFGQSDIVNDKLYLNYEKEYLNYVNTRGEIVELQSLDKMESDFYNNFKDSKSKKKFLKSKDQNKWLENNYSRTLFVNAASAQNLFESITTLRLKNTAAAAGYMQLLEELLKKYDSKLIWETLKSRLADHKKEEL